MPLSSLTARVDSPSPGEFRHHNACLALASVYKPHPSVVYTAEKVASTECVYFSGGLF